MQKQRKTILVAGGAGFIGSHLVEKLLAAGNRIICVDNFYTGSRENVAHFLDSREFTLMEQDVVEPIQINEPIGQIYNLASPASPLLYQENPVFTLVSNVYGAKNLLDLAKKHNADFLQASSSEIYGNPLLHPQPDSYWGNVNPVGPRACYDEGKRAAETLCADYQRMYNVGVRVARIFNTYGPRMAINDGRVISNFVVRALQNQDLCIYGDGSQTRSFQYIDDLIEGMIKMMGSGYPGPLNIGNPSEYSILEIARVIRRLTNSKSNIIFLPALEDDPQRRCPDISKTKAILGWEPKIPLEEGLKKTIGSFRQKINALSTSQL